MPSLIRWGCWGMSTETKRPHRFSSRETPLVYNQHLLVAVKQNFGDILWHQSFGRWGLISIQPMNAYDILYFGSTNIHKIPALLVWTEFELDSGVDLYCLIAPEWERACIVRLPWLKQHMGVWKRGIPWKWSLCICEGEKMIRHGKMGTYPILRQTHVFLLAEMYLNIW